MEDIIGIIVFLFFLSGLLGGNKKNKKRRQGEQPDSSGFAPSSSLFGESKIDLGDDGSRSLQSDLQSQKQKHQRDHLENLVVNYVERFSPKAAEKVASEIGKRKPTIKPHTTTPLRNKYAQQRTNMRSTLPTTTTLSVSRAGDVFRGLLVIGALVLLGVAFSGY